MRTLAVAALYVLLTGCGTIGLQDGAPSFAIDPSTIPDAVPREEPRAAYGNPESYVVAGERYQVLQDNSGYQERGIASWYGTKFHGRRTSSGEPYDMLAMTAAHRTLPLPTYLEVTNLANQRTVIVKVNDRGPFSSGRILDLSYAAAAKLDMLGNGTAEVTLRALTAQQPAPQAPAQPSVLATGTESGADVDSLPDNAGIYLQAGAFQQRANAERLRSQLAGLIDESSIHITAAPHDQITYYRVSVGPFSSPDEAATFSAQLDTLGIRPLRTESN